MADLILRTAKKWRILLEDMLLEKVHSFCQDVWSGPKSYTTLRLGMECAILYRSALTAPVPPPPELQA